MNEVVVENFRLTAALRYAERGWCVFPVHYPKSTHSGSVRCSCGDPACTNVGKHPMTTRGLHDATIDPQVIREWWRRWPSANIGVAAGEVSGFIVLDVDARDGGPDTLAELVTKNGPLPATIQVQSGSNPPGSHYFFSHPGRPLKNSAGRVGKGLDVRGDGGYVVAAPSLHASGQRYGWVRDMAPEDCELAPLPAWLLALMIEPPAPPRVMFNGRPIADNADHWLGKALVKATEGNRNDTGLWLAVQLRDNGISEAGAEDAMRRYAARVPGTGYLEREALASLRSAYLKPARQPAHAESFAAKVIKSNPPPKPKGAATELSAHLEDIINRRIFNVPWPWETLTRLTQALVPGSITVLCGDPGVGKTFFVLQCLRYWHGNAMDPIAFFIEKDRKFHTRRLLSQLEHDGRFVNWDWIAENPDAVRAALARNREQIDEIGKFIDSAPNERVTLDSLLAWIRQRASAGKRILVIDPITAVSAGADRWTRDDDFVIAAQSIATAHECSIVLITHAKKGNRPGSPSGHDMAAGAAYYRFADTTVWMVRSKKPRRLRYMTKCGPTSGEVEHVFQLHKTRDGTGAGSELAYMFKGMEYAEQGIVLGEAEDE